jgi:hypothetical protein
MFRLLKAGLVAALLQAAACLLVTALAGLTLAALGRPMMVFALRWSFLVVALGLSVTTSRFLDATIADMRKASRKSGMSLTPLVSALGFAAVGFFALALRPPPEPVASLVDSLFGASVSLIVWPAVMTVGMAAFGASTHAAARAAR